MNKIAATSHAIAGLRQQNETTIYKRPRPIQCSCYYLHTGSLPGLLHKLPQRPSHISCTRARRRASIQLARPRARRLPSTLRYEEHTVPKPCRRGMSNQTDQDQTNRFNLVAVSMSTTRLLGPQARSFSMARRSARATLSLPSTTLESTGSALATP